MASNVPRMGEPAVLTYEINGKPVKQTFLIDELTFSNVWDSKNPLPSNLRWRRIKLTGTIYTNVTIQTPPEPLPDPMHVDTV